MYRTIAAAVLAAAGIISPPLAHADGNQADLSRAVEQVYNQVQSRCTPQTPPHFQRIEVTGNGEGRIIDSNPSLGGPFQYLWGPPGSVGVPSADYRTVPAQPNGYWYINLEFC
jgi:hypothetical protein